MKPYGPGHYIYGFSVISNVFRSLNGKIDRVDHVDTTFADLNHARHRNLEFTGNIFHNVNEPAYNPAHLTYTQGSESATWTMDTDSYLPFGGYAKYVESVQPAGDITRSNGNRVYDLPWTQTEQGGDNKSVNLRWSQAVKGTVRYRVRMDETDG